ncbi:pore-forming ESAT-6 family protein [Cohnella fermenti]|uniref:ESAT-6-like protein n=1 Tax=Cohnella fermenti TaxID=2565925 RepID=A0A4S4BHE6_9BACL|nr:pore-forming ESAT-6 family protein [Cohnella fermenti]THF73924.1 WXG100 family type VII secretion target [Cohnella fermenti]
MAIEGISISLGEVSKTAGTIRTLNNSLSDRLDQIMKAMNDLESTWSSDASTTIRNKFNSLSPRFKEYYQVVDSYASFLDTTVTNYDTAETQINNNASAFK